MKTSWFIFAILLAAVVAGCAMTQRTLEYRELFSPKVAVVNYADGPVLRISGLCGHSAYVVETVRQLKSGRTIQVLVLISPLERDGTSGSFSTEVVLDDIDEVSFGEGREVLWRRYPSAAPKRTIPEFKAPEP